MSSLPESAREALSRSDAQRSTVYELRNSLAAAGLDVLSNGSFSIVLAHPEPDKVIKVTARPDACVAYYDWCAKANEAVDPYLPVIYSREWINDMHVAVLEKLEPLDNLEPSEEFLQAYGYVKHSRPSWAGWDTHYEGGTSNIMQREDGTPVITDPWYSFNVPDHAWQPGVLP